MLFNSHVFLFAFLPITWLVFRLLASQSHIRLARGWLVVASLFFYGWWNPRYLPLILLSAAFNYVLARAMDGSQRAPAVGIDDNGRIAVAWDGNGPGDPAGIFVRQVEGAPSFSVGDGVDDATMTFTGTLGQINAALEGLTFTPTPGYLGSASLLIVTDDQGNTGSGGALNDSDTIDISVSVAPQIDLDADDSRQAGVDFAAAFIEDGGPVTQWDNHGTAVAGVVSAVLNNGGAVGIAPGVKILSARIGIEGPTPETAQTRSKISRSSRLEKP